MSTHDVEAPDLPSAEDLADMDDNVLTMAVRRFHRESAEAVDPIAAFGAFNQHSSSPW